MTPTSSAWTKPKSTTQPIKKKLSNYQDIMAIGISANVHQDIQELLSFRNIYLSQLAKIYHKCNIHKKEEWLPFSSRNSTSSPPMSLILDKNLIDLTTESKIGINAFKITATNSRKRRLLSFAETLMCVIRKLILRGPKVTKRLQVLLNRKEIVLLPFLRKVG